MKDFTSLVEPFERNVIAQTEARGSRLQVWEPVCAALRQGSVPTALSRDEGKSTSSAPSNDECPDAKGYGCGVPALAISNCQGHDGSAGSSQGRGSCCLWVVRCLSDGRRETGTWIQRTSQNKIAAACSWLQSPRASTTPFRVFASITEDDARYSSEERRSRGWQLTCRHALPNYRREWKPKATRYRPQEHEACA